MRMLGRLREGAKAPQASQARASSPLRGAPFCAGFARVRASPLRGGDERSEVGGALPVFRCAHRPIFQHHFRLIVQHFLQI